jgi:hypothetical protein
MWPTPVHQPGTPSGWSRLDRRGRALAVAGAVALVVATALGSWLSLRFGQSATPITASTGGTAAALWTLDGAGYSASPVADPGPVSNDADMAFDQAHGVLVLWDHGCARLVMGFTGGCTAAVNRTWTWDGTTWAARPAGSTPADDGPGAMVYDAALGRVLYVNGTGLVWAWTGSDWRPAAASGPRVPPRGSAAGPTMLAAGYDPDRGRLVLALATATWLWDGVSWSSVPGGIDAGDARADAHLAYDTAHRQLVYVGAAHTWTWDGAGWLPHDQPPIASGTLGFDPERGGVVLVQQDAASCDRTACRTTTWSWNASVWTRLDLDPVPMLPLTRSGAFPPPTAFDASRGAMLLFASAA